MTPISQRSLLRGLALVALTGLAAAVGPVPAALARPARRPAKATATTARATATKAPIKLGSLWTSIDPVTGGRSPGEARKIGDAWAADVNAAGGVNGYRVQLVWRDSRATQSRGAQNVRELDQAGVLAIAGPEGGFHLPASDQLLLEAGLPVIGGTPNLPEFDEHPMYFPVSAGFRAGVAGDIAAAVAAGADRVRNLRCTETAWCTNDDAELAEAGRRAGVDVTSDAAPATGASFTGACNAARRDRIDFLRVAGVPLAAVVRDCARQGYHPTYAVAGGSTVTLGAVRGEVVLGRLSEVGAFYRGPETARFRRVLARTDVGSAAGQTAVQTWLGLEMAAAVIRKLSQPNPSRADFLNALYTVHGETLDGQVAPVDYTVQRPGTGLHAGNDCWTLHTMRDGRQTHVNAKGQPVDRLTFVCEPARTYKAKQGA